MNNDFDLGIVYSSAGTLIRDFLMEMGKGYDECEVRWFDDADIR